MICKPCTDDNHSDCHEQGCACWFCMPLLAHMGRSLCPLCREIAHRDPMKIREHMKTCGARPETEPRIGPLGPDPTLALKMGVDRIGGGHGGGQ